MSATAIVTPPSWLAPFLSSPVGLCAIFIAMAFFSLVLSGISQRLPARCGVDFTALAGVDDGRMLIALPFFYNAGYKRIVPLPVAGWFFGKGGYFAHPLVEAMLCFGTPLISWLSGGSSVLIALFILVCVITLFDCVAHWIPDFLTMSVTFLGLLTSLSLSSSVVSYAVAWFGAFFGLLTIGAIVRGQSMNYGDVWCFAAFAPFMTAADLPAYALASVLVALCQAIPYAALYPKASGEPLAIPFGPALSWAGFTMAFMAHCHSHALQSLAFFQA